MEGAPLKLVEGHIHQAWDRAFTSICEVWPTHEPAFGHVWLRGPQSHATTELLPSDLIPEPLEEWDFKAEKWRHWRTNPLPTNPGLREWPTMATVQKMAGHASASTTAGYDRRDRGVQRRAAVLLHVPYTVPED